MGTGHKTARLPFFNYKLNTNVINELFHKFILNQFIFKEEYWKRKKVKKKKKIYENENYFWVIGSMICILNAILRSHITTAQI